MRILEIILPVLVMLVLGMACRKLKLLTKSGIDNMKLLVTNIMLPVAIFHALATADYSVETWKLVGIMFVMLVVSFGVGFLLKPLMNGEYRKYLPFMVSVYEGGLMAYPLYTSLCGQENLSQIAVLDIAGLLFGFSIYMGMLGQVENGEKINAKKLQLDERGRHSFRIPYFRRYRPGEGSRLADDPVGQRDPQAFPVPSVRRKLLGYGRYRTVPCDYEPVQSVSDQYRNRTRLRNRPKIFRLRKGVARPAAPGSDVCRTNAQQSICGRRIRRRVAVRRGLPQVLRRFPGRGNTTHPAVEFRVERRCRT